MRRKYRVGREYWNEKYSQHFERKFQINIKYFEHDTFEIEDSNVFYFPVLAIWNQ